MPTDPSGVLRRIKRSLRDETWNSFESLEIFIRDIVEESSNQITDFSDGFEDKAGLSVWSPGFSTPPGGPDYMNRTAMSWHYYCWALGATPDDGPYDENLKALCDDLLGPITFDTVQQRASEMGGSATFLTEFGLCNPDA